MHAEPGPGKAVQERGGEVGLDEHPAEEVPGAEEGPGEVADKDLEVKEIVWLLQSRRGSAPSWV